MNLVKVPSPAPELELAEEVVAIPNIMQKNSFIRLIGTQLNHFTPNYGTFVYFDLKIINKCIHANGKGSESNCRQQLQRAGGNFTEPFA